MYESDGEFQARQRANWAEQDRRVAESDLSRARSDLIWAENDLRNAQSRSGIGGGYGGSSGGGGAGILIFWPFVYWRYTVFVVAFAMPALYLSQRGFIDFFRGSHNEFSLFIYLIAGYVLSASIGGLFARWVRLPWFRTALMLSVLVPLMVLQQLSYFDQVTAITEKAQHDAATGAKVANRSAHSSPTASAIIPSEDIAPPDLLAAIALSNHTDYGNRAGKFLKVYWNIFFYLLPAVVAYWLTVSGRRKIFLINLLSGWTVIGWIVAAVMVFRADGETSSAKPKVAPKAKSGGAPATT